MWYACSVSGADVCNILFILTDRLKQNQEGFAGGQGETNEEGIQLPKRPKLSCATEGGQHVFVKKKCQDIRLSWKRCCPLPVTISSGTAFVIGNTVYVHDHHGSYKIYEYETVQNVWCNEIHCPRLNFSVTVINGLLTLVGGCVSLFGQRLNTLLSLTENHGTKQWSEIYKTSSQSNI